MKHIIDNKEVNIEWEQLELSENHGSGCTNWIVQGEDEEGTMYFGDGSYQGDELMDVTEIELQSDLGFDK